MVLDSYYLSEKNWKDLISGAFFLIEGKALEEEKNQEELFVIF